MNKEIFLTELNPKDFNTIKVTHPYDITQNELRNRLCKAKNVHNVIKRLQKQGWKIVKQTNKEVVLVGIYDDALIGIFIDIVYSFIAQNHEASGVKVIQTFTRDK